MRIFVLDGHTLNPDDISWQPLTDLGDVTIFPRTPDHEVISRAREADAILVNKVVLDANKLNELSHLKYVGLMATGFDNVDIAAATRNDIAVTNVPSYATTATAQHTFALIMQLSNRVGIHNSSVHELEWVRNEDFSYFIEPLTELQGKTLGLIGYGRISREVEKMANAFGMKILVHSRHAEECAYGTLTDLDTLLSGSDVVSLHTSLTDETRGMINAERLAKMKDSAWLINTARGAMVVESDLADALHKGRIAAAAVDVLSKEPPLPDNPLLTAPNCIITPHISWASRESRIRLLNVLVDNIRSFLDGGNLNRLN